MKLFRLLSCLCAIIILCGCASVMPQNTHWSGHPIFSALDGGMTEDDSILVGLRDDGVVVWKQSGTNKVQHYLMVK